MKHILIYLIALAWPAGGAEADENPQGIEYLQFLDGFKVTVGNGYRIADYTKSPDGEHVSGSSSFAIRDSGGTLVQAEVLYHSGSFPDGAKAYLISTVRTNYGYLNGDYEPEAIALYYEDKSDIPEGYWIFYSVSEYEFVLFAVDMEKSPGHAKFLLLYFGGTDFSAEDQESFIRNLLGHFTVQFFEAAG